MDIKKGLKSEEPRVCEICNADFGKYTCPKCGIPYCSVACYKDVNKHLKCSESFYKECVEESMKDEEKYAKEEAGPSSAHMNEILQRFRQDQENVDELLYGEDEDKDECSEESEESSLDSDDDESLTNRMAGVNLDDANTVWTKLTLEEKKGFQSFVKDYNEKFNVNDDEELQKS